MEDAGRVDDFDLGEIREFHHLCQELQEQSDQISRRMCS